MSITSPVSDTKVPVIESSSKARVPTVCESIISVVTASTTAVAVLTLSLPTTAVCVIVCPTRLIRVDVDGDIKVALSVVSVLNIPAEIFNSWSLGYVILGVSFNKALKKISWPFLLPFLWYSCNTFLTKFLLFKPVVRFVGIVFKNVFLKFSKKSSRVSFISV